MIEFRITERFSEKLMRSYEPNGWMDGRREYKIFGESFNFSYFDIKINGIRYRKETAEFIDIYEKEKLWMLLTI